MLSATQAGNALGYSYDVAGRRTQMNYGGGRSSIMITL
jgi:YD repeat-containing protein